MDVDRADGRPPSDQGDLVTPDEHAPGLRRGPAVVLLAAATVVVCAVLGATGVLQTPQARAEAAAARPDPLAVAVDALAAASGDLVGMLNSPVADSATPAPLPTATTAPAEAPVDPAAAPVDPAATPVDPAVTPAPESEPMTRLVPTVLPSDSGEGRRVVYALADQRVWLVEADGFVSATYRVSGRVDLPLVGTYAVYSHSPRAEGVTGQERVSDLVRFTSSEAGAIGFHTVPVDMAGVPAQQPSQLGEPLSGGSVRQSADDAKRLYGWAVVGTTVVVVP